MSVNEGFVNWSGCTSCRKAGEECLSCERARVSEEIERAHAEERDCGRDDCPTCCSHDERTGPGICLNCGDEEDLGAAIDRAMDAREDR